MLTHRRTDECDPACDVVGQSRSPRHGSADSCSQDRGENGHISVPPRQAFCGSSAAEADFLNQSHTRPSCGTSFPRSSPPPPASPPEWEPRIPAHPAMCGRKKSPVRAGTWAMVGTGIAHLDQVEVGGQSRVEVIPGFHLVSPFTDGTQ